MTVPVPLSSFGEGDDDSYAWSTRLPKGGNQFLLDLMSEWQLHNKSQTLAVAVQFLFTYLDTIIKSEDAEFSEGLKVKMEYIRADQEADAWDDVLNSLARRMDRINKTDNPKILVQLKETAKRFAKTSGVAWPPPDQPLISYDSEARYILERILVTASKKETNRISARELSQSCRWENAIIMPILERLEQHAHIKLERQKRSGPPTVWITIPSMPTGKKDQSHSRKHDRKEGEPF